MQLLKLSIFIILIFSITSFEKVKCIDDDDQILWKSERKLVWDDFKGIADTSKINETFIDSLINKKNRK